MRREKIVTTVTLGLLLLLSVSPALATDFSSTNFIDRDPVVDEYGGRSTSTSFNALSAGGQAAIGESTSTSFILRSGFLYFAEATAATSSSSTTSGGGGGGGVWVGSVQTGGGTTTPQIIFSGQTDRPATISILQNGQPLTLYRNDLEGKFTIPVYNLSPGYYYFTVFGNDALGNKSNSKFYSVYILNNTTAEIKEIYLNFAGLPPPAIKTGPLTAALPQIFQTPPATTIKYVSLVPPLFKKIMPLFANRLIVSLSHQPFLEKITETYTVSPKISLATVIAIAWLVFIIFIAIRFRLGD